MNYRIQLVVGDDADFFLEEWEPGGVEISETAVGLFNPQDPGRGPGLKERLRVYGLEMVCFGMMDLLKVGMSKEWLWLGVRWEKERESRFLGDVAARIQSLLGPGFHEDQERQLRLLRLVQQTVKRYGTPARIEGEYRRSHGRTDRIWVYRTGIVSYDRTPHPLPFLRDVVRLVAP